MAGKSENKIKLKTYGRNKCLVYFTNTEIKKPHFGLEKLKMLQNKIHVRQEFNI